MIRRLLAQWRKATTHHATVGGVELRHRTAKSLGLSGNAERHDHVDLSDTEKQQIADIERRWNGGQR